MSRLRNDMPVQRPVKLSLEISQTEVHVQCLKKRTNEI